MFGAIMKLTMYAFLLAIGTFSQCTYAQNTKAYMKTWMDKWRYADRNSRMCDNWLNYAKHYACGSRLDLDGGYSNWGAYERCKSCEKKITYRRSRACDKPVPAGKGAKCKEASVEELACGMQGFCKEISHEALVKAEKEGTNQTTLQDCMGWCRAKGDCGFVAYGVRKEKKEKWCLRFSKLQAAKGCSPTYTMEEQKRKADVDVEYNIHYNNDRCDNFNFEHHTCGYIKDGVPHCKSWDQKHLVGPFYEQGFEMEDGEVKYDSKGQKIPIPFDESSCRKKCEETKGCGVFIVGKMDGDSPGWCDLWEKGTARICSVKQEHSWKLYSKNSCKSFRADAPLEPLNSFEGLSDDQAEDESAALDRVKEDHEEEDDKFARDEEEEEDNMPEKGMEVLSDIIFGRQEASQFLRKRVRRDLYHECCTETCDYHEVWELCH